MYSIIVPTLNEADTIAAFIERLLEQEGDFETILADGGSTDGTVQAVSGIPRVRFVLSEQGRGRQMNEGAKVARGDILLFLHADSCLPHGALRMIGDALSDPAVSAGCFPLRFDSPSFLLRAFSLFSRINHTLFTYGDQGLFLRSRTFKALGGFKDIPIMEDVEFQQRLRIAGRFVKIPQPLVTSPRRYLKNGVVRQQMINTVLVLLYHLGASPSFLKRFYT